MKKVLRILDLILIVIKKIFEAVTYLNNYGDIADSSLDKTDEIRILIRIPIGESLN